MEKRFSKWTLTCFLLLALVACSKVPEEDKVIEIKDAKTHKANTENKTKVLTFSLYSEPQRTEENTSWWNTTSIYYIWVRSYYDSDNDGNGDLHGIESKLDYIKALGVETILLSPIFESPSYHGYDVTDFESIEKDFGDWGDLDSLIAACNKRGLKIMLDVPINHVSDQHSWFQKALEKEAPHENYFIWSATQKSGYAKPWSVEQSPGAVWHYKLDQPDRYYYAAFDYSQPDLNYQNAFIRNHTRELFLKLAGLGIDGVRLDAVRYLIETGPIPLQADTIETREYLEEVKSSVKQDYPDFYFLGEILTDISIANAYLQINKAIDQLYDFGTNFLIHDIVKNAHIKKDESIEISIEQQRSLLKLALSERLQNRFSNGNQPKDFVTFLNSHDFDRLSAEKGLTLFQQKLGASVLLLMPGTVSIYYGDEIGLPQLKRGDDSFIRAPMHWDSTKNAGFSDENVTWIDTKEFFPWIPSFMPWWGQLVNQDMRQFPNVETQLTQPDSLLTHHKRLLDIRNQHKKFFTPTRIEYIQKENDIFILNYEKDDEYLQIAINLGEQKHSHIFPNTNNILGIEPGGFAVKLNKSKD